MPCIRRSLCESSPAYQHMIGRSCAALIGKNMRNELKRDGNQPSCFKAAEICSPAMRRNGRRSRMVA
jgi:hypothetical protein